MGVPTTKLENASNQGDVLERPLDGFLCFSIYSTGLAFNRMYKPRLDKLGLTYVQYLVIVSLAERDDQKVSELGDQMFLESNTLTPLLKRLEGVGLLTRTRDNNDERVVRVRLTEQGRAIAQEASCLPNEVRELVKLTPTQLDEMQAQLTTLRSFLLANAQDSRTSALLPLRSEEL
jgi:DNA-binding MarR family transcriptional regulator